MKPYKRQYKMLYNRTLIFILLICRQVNDSKGSRSFDIRWTKANCTIIDNTVIAKFMCPIRELPKNRGNYLEVYFQPKQDLKKITLDLKLFVSKDKNKEKNFLKFRTDACKLTTFQSKNPIVTAVFQSILKGNNFLQNCPLKANFSYVMKYFALNPDYFPRYTPDMDFTTKLNLFTFKKHLIYVNIAASIRKANI